MTRLSSRVVLTLSLCLASIACAAPVSSAGVTITRPPAAAGVAVTSGAPTAAVRPVRPPKGGKWRVGYVDSGDYSEYPLTLRGIVQGLEALGWLSVPDIPPALDSEQLWAFLAGHTHSDYIEFVRDAWWHPGFADATQRAALRHTIQNRVATLGDIDLIIAMGTWAGQDMAALEAPVPTIVASTSDPVSSHIIQSSNDSGLHNLHARNEPGRYQRQVQMFHDIIAFKRLGMVYEDSEDGKVYSGLKAAQEVAQRSGFTIHACHAASNGVTRAQATENALDCYRRLLPDIDAAYVTVHRGVNADSIKTVAEILREANVPSFSMLGSKEVEQGMLLGLAQADSSYLGMFYAQTIAQIFNGTPARELNQVWFEPAKLAINVDTARRIGFDPPVDTLLAADEIFPESIIDSN